MNLENSGNNKEEASTDAYYICVFKRILDGKEKLENFDLLNFRNMCLTFMVLDNIGERVCLVDKEFNIVLSNQLYNDYHSKDKSGVIGKKCYSVEYGKDKPCFEEGEECSVLKVFQTGRIIQRFEYAKDKEGNQNISEIKCYPIKDYQDNILLALFAEKDVTAAKKMENELQEKVRELQEFYDIAIGRELRMIELKEEVDKLKSELEELKKL